eukprot:TRINITY_DN162_c10_g1_i1.p1 TRINITY_DN162_c10_g1~~TRINITY_DN162_c10_g1_i1.p1  ORF type:complete len:500 (-),score=91.90 TRINITY_DN162_c10_g1_i1:130-1539(-)
MSPLALLHVLLLLCSLLLFSSSTGTAGSPAAAPTAPSPSPTQQSQWRAVDWTNAIGLAGFIHKSTRCLLAADALYLEIVEEIKLFCKNAQLTVSAISVSEVRYRGYAGARFGQHVFGQSPFPWGLFVNASFSIENEQHQFHFYRDPVGHLYPIAKYQWATPIASGESDSASHHNSDPINFMTYNIYHYNEGYSQRMEHIAAQIRSLNADVVALQEVRLSSFQHPGGGGAHGSQIADLATMLPEFHFLYQHAMIEFPRGFMSGVHTEEGVAILTKYPVIATDHLHLSRNFTDREDAHSRVCLGVTVLAEQGPVSVFSLHFPLSQWARTRNVVELRKWLKSFPEPHLLAGDFNMEPHALPILFLNGKRSIGFEEANYSEVYEGVSLEEGWSYNTHHAETRKRIDFVFYSPSLSLLSRQMVGRELAASPENVAAAAEESPKSRIHPSDHRALFCSFAPVSVTTAPLLPKSEL